MTDPSNPDTPDDENDIKLLATVLSDIDTLLVLKATSVHLLRVYGLLEEAIDAAACTLKPTAPSLLIRKLVGSATVRAARSARSTSADRNLCGPRDMPISLINCRLRLSQHIC